MSPLRATPHARRLRLSPPAVALVLAVTGCAGARPGQDAAPDRPEVLVEVLPRRAELRVDGEPVGSGGRVLTVPDPRRRYLISATAAGFDPAERADTGAELAGARVVLALRPAGTPGQGALDPDDPYVLASAAEVLLRRGDGDAAREYAARASSLAPGSPAVRRVLDELDRGRAASSIEVRPDAGRAP